MEIIQAAILGVVQGLTEFLPISSSAHLYLVPFFFGWDYQGLQFDVALHWGTLLAVVWIFWRDYLEILKSPKMIGYLVLGSVPAGLAGFLLRDQIETVFRNPIVTVFTLSGFALLLWLADKKSKQNQNLTNLNSKKSFLIGVAQALSLVPGVSRSGVTTMAGLFANLSRQQAVRFAFLLSGPVIFGAGLVALKDLQEINSALIAGFIAAAISGFAAIKFLLNYVSKNNFNVFVWYRIVLAAVIVFTLILRK